MTSRLQAIYRVRSDPASIEERAHAIAVEQSVEMPITAIDDDEVLAHIVGCVEAIEPCGEDVFDVCVSLATATVGTDAGQLVNMLFGNTSLHEDVVLHDVELPAELCVAFGGPRHGVHGLRRRVGAQERALTCAALKPQGLAPERLADLAARFARGGVDYVKDDHGLAEQTYSPFPARLAAVTAALDRVNAATGQRTRYVPSLSGDLDAMRRQVQWARDSGVDAVMIAPMIAGLSNLHRLVRENQDIAFIGHPSLAGAARIAPPLLFGRLFRLFGADAFIYPHHGGRFGYSPDTCRTLACAGRADWHGLAPSMPVPAGGMSRARVGEMLDFYGADVMLLIGGSLLEAGERLTEETAAFVDAVRRHAYILQS